MSGMKDMFGDWPYGDAHARRTDPDTSHAAARSVEPEANNLESLVAGAISPFGSICDEICAATGLSWNTVSPRLAPLLRKGVVFLRINPDTGKPITRPGKSGRRQQVYFRLDPNLIYPGKEPDFVFPEE